MKTTDCTFIIPIKIESSDRKRNCQVVLNYLLDNLDYNISILEVGSNSVHECVDLNNSKISYNRIELLPTEPFHRTKYLNILAKKCNSDIVCSYDTDVLLPLKSYSKAVRAISSNKYDIIYPFGQGQFQRKVYLPEGINKINSLKDLNNFKIEQERSYCGHCNFQKKSVYEKAGFENEEFISYAPEDREKLYRYKRLGFKIGRINDLVYHLEHERTADSWITNPHFEKNCLIFDKIKKMNDDEFQEYCQKLRSQQ
jgi:hypothetical protein